MLLRSAFIEPATPIVRAVPPTGPDWVHEVKFDGFRVQLHSAAGKARVYSRNGHDFAGRFRPIATALARLPVDAAILDAELVRCGDDGMPDFRALMHGGTGHLCAYAFDLMAIDGEDLRSRPLFERRALLAYLIAGAADPLLRFSESFQDPLRLLAAAEGLGLEGIVSKPRNGYYAGGTRCGWMKVKTRAWRAANRDRWRMFERVRH